MYAIYKNQHYKYVDNRIRKEIVTWKASKAISGFMKDYYIDLYYKVILDDELSDIYEVKFYVEYDCGIPDIDTFWRITSDNLLENNAILLRFGDGILPDWEVEEKYVCTKKVDQKDLASAKAIYTIYKENGVALESPKKIERILSIDACIDLCKTYDSL